MKTIFERLSEEDWKITHDLCVGIYLDGACYEFAIALNRGIGWQMYGIMQNDVIRHAVVKDDKEIYHDARGSVSEEELGKPFGLSAPYELKAVTEEDLVNVRPISKTFGVARASLLAEALWPEYPWKENSFRLRTMAFLDDLGELCKKHRVWIRAPYETTPIIVDQMVGDEGFRFRPSMTGQYFFDRYLEGQIRS